MVAYENMLKQEFVSEVDIFKRLLHPVNRIQPKEAPDCGVGTKVGITEWVLDVLQHEHHFKYRRDHEVQEEKLPCQLKITLASQMDVINK